MSEERVVNLMESKLNLLCRSTQLLDFLVPPFPVIVAVEQEIRESNPREESDNSNRVFIYYRNTRGNSLLFKINDTLGFDSKFDIDDFLSGYAKQIDSDLEAIEGDELAKMRFTVLSALNLSLGLIVGVDKDTTKGRTKNLSVSVANSILTCLYDNSKDVMIMCREGGDENDRKVIITNMWSMSKQ